MIAAMRAEYELVVRRFGRLRSLELLDLHAVADDVYESRFEDTDTNLTGVNVKVGDAAAVAVPRNNDSPEANGWVGNAGRFLIPQTGTVLFAGSTNNFNNLTVASGTAQLGDAGTDNFSITGTADVKSGATLDVHTYTREVGSIAGVGSITLGTGGALTVGSDNASTEFSGIMSDAGSFTKTGSGTLALSGGNTYSGATTIAGGMILVKLASALNNTAVTVQNGGTLAVNFGVNLTHAATFDSGSTLGGNGTYTPGGTFGPTGVHIAPGLSVGTLTVGNNVDLHDLGVLDIQVDGASADLLQVTGNLTLGGSSVLNVTVLNPGTFTSIPIATYTGSLIGTKFTTENLAGYSISYDTPGQILLLPEPATMALLGLGALGMAFNRRRRR